jgi:small-conductance mechanosensitive channel
LIKRSRLLTLSVLVITSVLLWFVNFRYPNTYLEKVALTALASAIIYFIFELVFEGLVTKRIEEPKTRYSLRKIASILSIAIFLIILVAIWVGNPQNVLIAFGLVGAGIAIALQDVVKNFIGGIMILVNSIYGVGDRVEINQKYGDVIDISILYTTLLETREWVAGDQATGRLVTVPNGAVLSGTIQNYSKDFDFIWDEIAIPITYDSDWNEAATKILDIVTRETKEMSEQAEKNMRQIEEKYYFTKRSLQPAIFLSLTDNWINFDVRYVTGIRQRRLLHDKLSRLILKEIENSEKVKIASATMNITGFPPVKLKRGNGE